MARPRLVAVAPLSIDRFESFLGAEALALARQRAETLRERLGENAIWNVNTTAVGGGVAEMLPPLVGYARGARDRRPLGGDRGRPGLLPRHQAPAPCAARLARRRLAARRGRARRSTRRPCEANAAELCPLVRRGDVVLLHDPQTPGLAPHLAAAGARADLALPHRPRRAGRARSSAAGSSCEPYLEHVPRFVFSREAYVPECCDHGKSRVIPPSIDPFSPKNQELDERAVHTILVHAGLVEGPPPEPPTTASCATTARPARVERRADVRPAGAGADLGDAAGRAGLALGSAQGHDRRDARLRAARRRHRAGERRAGAGGPERRARSRTIPRARAVFEAVDAAWRALPHGVRDRIHLASLPDHATSTRTPRS